MPAGTSREEHGRRLELVVQHTSNMVVVTNARREIEWVNPAYTRVTGWTLDEVRGRNPRSFLHGPRTSVLAASRLGQLLRNGLPVHDFEMVNYKKSGEAYWVSLDIQPIADPQGRVSEYVAIQSDITARKRAELETARNLRRLAEAQRMARLCVIEHRLADATLACGEDAAGLLGLPEGRHRIGYEDLLARVHPDDAAAVRERYESAINVGAPYEQEYRLRGADGSTRWVHAHGTLEGWDDGPGAVFRLALQDVTEARRAAQLAREKAVLEQAAHTQMAALSRVSHELRTPLHAVLGFADMVERQAEPQLPARTLGHLRQIRDAARHMLLIVNDILDLTRAHDGRLGFERDTVDLDAVVRQALTMVEPLAAERGIALRAQPSGVPVYARADRRRLLQVLINLVSNAIKYNRRGGHVEVRTHVAEGGHVAIAVTDDGIGVATADLPRLFEPFFRVPAAHDAGMQSSGLGLAIARTLARGMGGDIGAESRQGRGSTFTVTLPALRRPPAARPVPKAADTPEDGRKRVLYIEDNEVNRELMAGYVAARPDIELTSCPTGTDGLAAARRLRPDLMFIDMHLPDMSGIEIMQAVLADPLLHRTPCIAFSADSDEAAVDDAIRTGFREYLCKPLATASLLEAIDRHLDREPLTTRV